MFSTCSIYIQIHNSMLQRRDTECAIRALSRLVLQGKSQVLYLCVSMPLCICVLVLLYICVLMLCV